MTSLQARAYKLLDKHLGELQDSLNFYASTLQKHWQEQEIANQIANEISQA